VRLFRPIAKEIKEEILLKIKQGTKVLVLADQDGISDKTIYNWLARTVYPPVSWAKYQQLRGENEERKRIIGMMALDLEMPYLLHIGRVIVFGRISRPWCVTTLPLLKNPLWLKRWNDFQTFSR